MHIVTFQIKFDFPSFHSYNWIASFPSFLKSEIQAHSSACKSVGFHQKIIIFKKLNIYMPEMETNFVLMDTRLHLK